MNISLTKDTTAASASAADAVITSSEGFVDAARAGIMQAVTDNPADSHPTDTSKNFFGVARTATCRPAGSLWPSRRARRILLRDIGRVSAGLASGGDFHHPRSRSVNEPLRRRDDSVRGGGGGGIVFREADGPGVLLGDSLRRVVDPSDKSHLEKILESSWIPTVVADTSTRLV